jgi:hypothetical protein
LIDAIRRLAAERCLRGGTDSALECLLEGAGLKPLEPCTGEAHSNPHIDHCFLCAPRWGWVGAVEVVS